MIETYAHPLEGYNQDQIQCSSCAEQIDFNGLVPLSVAMCPTCGGTNFVPQKIGRFWLYYPLAVGGMGAVYKAYHENEPDMLYAVKILPRQERENTTLIRNLKEEIHIMNDLGEHPAMVSSPANGKEDGEFFLATRFVAGEGLDERILRLGRVDELDALLIALRILSVEIHIYNSGYLYRDLKPENILISQEDGAFLCDFGICMELEKVRRTDQGDILQGSPLYIPPERLLGEGEDAYSEIYSLGLVLYHALTGTPYHNADEVETIAQMHIGRFGSDHHNERMAQLQTDTARVISKMIRRDAHDRYQCFMEVERDLFAILSNRLVS